MALKELSDKGPDGTRLGQTAADLVAFHGKTPVSMASVTLSAAITAGATLAALAPAFAELYTALKNKGLVA